MDQSSYSTREESERQVRKRLVNGMDEEARALLNHLFAGVRGYLELTYIAPPGVTIEGPHIVTESYRIGQDKPNWDHVRAMNDKGYGIYYGLTAKREQRGPYNRSDERNSAVCSVLWVDIDMQDGAYPTKAKAFDALCEFRPVPTVTIDSGGGMHGLWRIEPVVITAQTLPLIKAHLAALAQAIKGDPHVAETARVFRLPGTINTKLDRGGARCEIAEGGANWIIQSRYLLSQFPRLDRPTPRPMPRLALPDGVRLKLPQWVQDYVSAGAPEGNRNNRLFAAAIEYRANGFSYSDAQRDLIARATADGLSEREGERTIQSAWKAPCGMPNVAPHVRALAACSAVIAGGVA